MHCVAQMLISFGYGIPDEARIAKGVYVVKDGFTKGMRDEGTECLNGIVTKERQGL
jgi:hypothetical protein